MSPHREEQLHSAVAEALQALAPDNAAEIAWGQWVVSGGIARRVTARLQFPWLHLSSAAGRGHIHDSAVARSAWELLEVNAALSGSAKFALPPLSRRVEAMAAVRLDASADDPARASVEAEVAAGLADISEAILRLQNWAVLGESAAADAGQTDVDFGALCGAAGWPGHARRGGVVAAPLEAPGSHVQAILGGARADQAVVEIASAEVACEESRQAIGVLLLQVAGATPMVRPAVRQGERGRAIVLEAALGRRPDAQGMAHALSALSVAARACVAEVAALAADEEMSAMYLRQRGWSPLHERVEVMPGNSEVLWPQRP